MGYIIYSDGRTDLDTTAFRYKLTDSAGTLVKDWTTGATWTEEPAGTYYLDDEDAVPGTYYAVEPATGQVGGAGMVPEPMRGTDGALLAEDYIAPPTDYAKEDTLNNLALVVNASQDDLILINKWILGKLVKQTVSSTQHDLILYDDDNTTILKIWRVDTLTGTRSAANNS